VLRIAAVVDENSCEMINTRIAFLKRSMSNVPSVLRNFIRFSDARLHAELSINIYSLHGLEALIGRNSAGMPFIDCGMVLQSGIAADTCAFADQFHQFAAR